MAHNLGIASIDKNIFLLSKVMSRRKVSVQLASSSDGFNFVIRPEVPAIRDEKGKEENIEKCEDFKISKLDGDYFLTYKYFTSKGKYATHGAVSKDLVKWKKLGKLSKIGGTGSVVPNYKYKDKYVMYFGERSIKVALSKDLKTWKVLHGSVLEPRGNSFDNPLIEVSNCMLTDHGIYLAYNAKTGENGYHSIGAAVFDKNDPVKLLWRSDSPVWKINDVWKSRGAFPIGVIQVNGTPVSYWYVEGEGIRAVYLEQDLKERPVLQGFDGNPIIQPIKEHWWESIATFNPAAVYEDGKVHILYRSVGNTNTSILGYASSEDGLHIDERLPEPVYVHTLPKGQKPKRPQQNLMPFYSPIVGWAGGCEDPRLTKIGDRFYMTFVSFDGWTSPRVAMTSIKVKDFLNRKWDWDRPVIISPPNVVDKNCVFFPEKVNGKYVIFHRIFPSILIDFVDDLNYDGTRWLRTLAKITPRQGMWDSRKLGAGPPPIKTKDGWLLIYHAVDDVDPNYRYRIGAMVLDLKDPTKILYRCKKPILEPYGDDANIAYPCGAVVIKNKLFVYYGSADRTVKVATADLGYLIDGLKESGEPKITPVNILSV